MLKTIRETKDLDDDTTEKLNAAIERCKTMFGVEAASAAAVASTQDLKRRVRSISNTRKLTRAMELVASARLRRAQLRIEAMRPTPTACSS